MRIWKVSEYNYFLASELLKSKINRFTIALAILRCHTAVAIVTKKELRVHHEIVHFPPYNLLFIPKFVEIKRLSIVLVQSFITSDINI